MQREQKTATVQVMAGSVALEGSLAIPDGARGVVLFAHGSGSSRHSPRNRFVAEVLRAGGMATLLLDLLTPGEEQIDARTAELRFNIGLLAERVAGAAGWLQQRPETRELKIGCFGASTGAGAALVAAADYPDQIAAVVSRGGRPDLAGPALAHVRAPTLLIVGGNDVPVRDMNEQARRQIPARCELAIIPGATHLFPEPDALGQVARLARDWFSHWLLP